MRFTIDEVKNIREQFQKGITRKQLAAANSCRYSVIHAIVKNFSYYDPTFKPVMKKEFDFEYANKLKRQGKSLAEIARLEAKKTRRDKNLSVESVRTKLNKGQAV